MLSRVLAFCAALALGTSTLSAQITSTTNRLKLDDGLGHELIIAPPTAGWPSTGTFTWTLPFPPTGVASGFVQAGTATLTSLQWDDVNKHWKAVVGGGLTGSGTADVIPKWSSSTVLTNSLISDNGSTVSITDGALLLSGTIGATPASGAGTRMMWVPNKAAFRAGMVTGTQWDAGSIGMRSIAMGQDVSAPGAAAVALGYGNVASGAAAMALGGSTTASGNFSTSMGENSQATGAWSIAGGSNAKATGSQSIALGDNNLAAAQYAVAIGASAQASATGAIAIGAGTAASGQFSLALGYTTQSKGSASTAMGGETIASGNYSTAMGYQTSASGAYSLAGGLSTTASGSAATALGYTVTASGDYAIASGQQSVASGAMSTAFGGVAVASGLLSTSIGYLSTASGSFSTALGSNANTNSMPGSFAYGDASGAATSNTTGNQFMVRASGGSIFYTTTNNTTGVTLAAGANSWASLSDSTKKENRLVIDGDDLLNKLSNIWLGSWNYKSQDKSIRHYGPMAQEFFAAFGNDGVGIIGNDTTLATADVDGVTLIAVKALIDRNNALNERNSALESRVELLEAMSRKLAASNEAIIQKALLAK